jgi:hypothetical protein
MATMATQFGDQMTFVAPAESITSKRVAQFFFACFWTIIFTGSVRKWLFPHIAAFYLLQDVPITLAYLYAFTKGYFSRGLLFLYIFFLGSLVTLQALLQIVVIGLSPLIAFVGLHHYLFYLPMMLIFPLGLTPKYRRNFIRWNLWITLPFFLLSIAQAMSSTGAWVNRTTEGDAMGLPGVDIARVCGPFNFAVFYGIWIGTALSMALGEWILPRDKRVFKNKFILPVSTFCLGIMALVSGSRQNILLCAGAVLGMGVAAILIRSFRVIAVILVVIISLPIAAGAVYIISPVEFATVQDRFTGERTSENLKDRLGASFYSWLTEPEISLIGKGVGMGVDAAHFGSSDAYNFTYSLSEADMTRNVMELGTPVGLLYEFSRIGMALGMILLAYSLVRVSPHCLPLAFMLFGQVFADLTRAATMTFTQVMIGYSFIWAVYLYPVTEDTQLAIPDLETTELAVS